MIDVMVSVRAVSSFQKGIGAMIMCFASWDRPGGLNTMFKSYYGLELPQPHFWVLLGKSKPPMNMEVKPETYFLQVPDDWSCHEDPEKCDPKVVREIERLVKIKGAQGIFLPLEYHFYPYIRQLDLPILYISHLLNRPLVQSARRQWYSELAEVKRGIHTDLVRMRAEEEALRKSRYVLCSSAQARVELNRYYELPMSAEVYDMKLGTDKDRWQDVEFGSLNEVLFFGRFAHQKGIPNIKISPECGLRLVAVGSGKLESWLLVNAGPISLEPYATDLKPHLNRAAFCIFPSHYEPWGLTLTEALAAGKICVAQSGVSGHELQIRHGDNGFLVDFNGTSLDRLIESIIRTDADFVRISARARATASCLSEHLSQVQEIYLRFVSGLPASKAPFGEYA